MSQKQNSQTRVCVLGASGYIGSHIVARLLEEGFQVAAAIRDPDDETKVAHLRALRNSENLSIFKVDILSEDSVDLTLDAVMTGCEYVIHAASPNPVQKTLTGDAAQREVVEPLVEGIENVLSACKRAKKLKRLILTSSFASMGDGEALKANHTYTESDWNDTSALDTPIGAYNHAKAIAEETAFALAKKHKIEMTAICPYAVFGPSLGPQMSASMFGVKQMLEGAFRNGAPAVRIGVVDVRDVAIAHVRALTAPVAGRRFLLAANPMVSFLQVTNAIQQSNPLLYQDYPLPTQETPMWHYTANKRRMGGVLASQTIEIDTTPSEDMLDLEYRPLVETMGDAAVSAIEHGFVKEPSPVTDQVVSLVKVGVVVLGVSGIAYYALKHWKSK
mmetsp:Transcript_27384/g.33269  ORF Transcript_27384/g.33269 Transcript_27384/m.33269 type:complete len:389 (+) Transcript_27384:188-1354(+)|eukprot:CAMPEP_0197845410 /NCGR_PEP_ID=MMETSP1438-20131217/2349_1 /TAXON_ID=1461541 /ORGANISM="Pterosperma sp., Strain CCMP1384" /LENGTH=388 /DNA_ID=CAMNT_0043456695 /DNA_START=179 /DNA_END=1345 /DNA_ORIENTATION=+